MSIIGFNFKKISAEKDNKVTGKINIKNNLSIKNVEQEKLSLGKSEDVLSFNFRYSVDYEPQVGKIVLEGNILCMEDPKKVKSILDSWKKDKKIPEDIAPPILNTILARCNIKSLTISQDLNLPPHIRLPIVKNSESKK